MNFLLHSSKVLIRTFSSFFLFLIIYLKLFFLNLTSHFSEFHLYSRLILSKSIFSQHFWRWCENVHNRYRFSLNWSLLKWENWHLWWCIFTLHTFVIDWTWIVAKWSFANSGWCHGDSEWDDVVIQSSQAVKIWRFWQGWSDWIHVQLLSCGWVRFLADEGIEVDNIVFHHCKWRRLTSAGADWTWQWTWQRTVLLWEERCFVWEVESNSVNWKKYSELVLNCRK